MKKGILILNQFYYPEYVTASVLITQMAEDAAAAGIPVDVLCGKPREYLPDGMKPPKRETHNGVRIRRASYLQLSRKSKIGRLVNYFSFIASMAFRWPTLLGYRLIVVNTMPPLLPLIPALMNRLFGAKFAFVCYDLYPELAIRMGAIRRGSIVDRVMSRTNRLAYARASAVVALGDEMKRYMVDSCLIRDESRVRVIPNWFDGDPGAYEPLGGEPKTQFTVVYAGNMGVCQDMDTIVRCAELLKDEPGVRFEFAGHGVKADGIKAEAERAGLANVTVHGYLTGEEYNALMASADCFIVSLEKGIEGLAVPSKTYSYLAAGRPIFAIIDSGTDISRMLDVYDCGQTFPSGSQTGMAGWIRELMADRARLARMGQNARRLYEEHYTREICTKQYIELYRELGVTPCLPAKPY